MAPTAEREHRVELPAAATRAERARPRARTAPPDGLESPRAAPPEALNLPRSAPPTVRIDVPSQSGGSVPLQRWRRAVRVSARKLEFPPQCACCMGPADTQFAATHERRSGQRRVKVETFSWDFPYCRRCLAHAGQAATVNRRAALIAVLPTVLALLGGIATGAYAIGALLGGVLLIVLWVLLRARYMQAARQTATPQCACLSHAVEYQGFHGTLHRFRFASSDYAAAFEAVNEAKLVRD